MFTTNWVGKHWLASLDEFITKTSGMSQHTETVNPFVICFFIKCLVSVITAVYGQTLIFEIIFKFRCPRYPNLDPTYCQLVYDPTNPCCQKPQCMTVSPTPGPGISVPPPTPAPSPDVCVYQGVAYRQGQTFNQGCDKICKCEDSMTGKITCTDR